MADTELITPAAVFGAPMITRAYPLDDIHVKPGDGRTVDAYAAVFNVEAEIHDFEGHYVEVNDPGAFDKTISRAKSTGGYRVGVFYNHGMTIHGTPSERGSMPIGVPLEITVDSKGLRTVTRYSKTPQADELLELINSGAITAQSYTGPILKSNPALSRSQRRRGGYLPTSDGQLQTVRRMELGLIEYGPTPLPAYADAAIMGVRGWNLGDYQSPLDPDEDQTPDASDESAHDEPLNDPAVRHARLQRRIRAALVARGGPS